MKKIISFFGLFCLLSTVVVAQNSFARGLEFDDEEYDRLPHSSDFIKSGRKALKTKVDLSPYCPEVRHQGDISSCVGWSLGYAAMTIERAIQNGWTDKREINTNANSALYVFNQISEGNCNAGITFPAALEHILNEGNCLRQDFDAKMDVNDCNAPVPQVVDRYRIQHFEPLFRSNAPPDKKIRKVRMVLAQKKPVAMGMTIRNNFMQLGSSDSQWRPHIGDTGWANGHAMVVVGYDDNRFAKGQSREADMRGAFKIMNSWGKEWGQRGFIWVRYRYFAEFCKQAFAIVLEGGEPIVLNEKVLAAREPEVRDESRSRVGRATDKSNGQSVALKGAFGFRQFIRWDEEEGPQFEEARVELENNQYRLAGNWKIGDRFQLYVKNGFDQGFIYVFSIDQTGKAEVHFPRSERYSAKFQGQEQSALIWESGSELTIPAPQKALTLVQRGTDHLVALYSTSKLKPAYLGKLIEILSEDTSDLTGTLFEVLDKYVVPPSDINYSDGRMGFDVNSNSGGRIVPIVLSVDVN